MRLLRASNARLRLTLLYSGMFLLLGTIAVIVIFVLAHGGGTVSVSGAVPSVVTRVGHGRTVALRITPARNIAVEQRGADLGRLLAIIGVVLALTALGSAILGWFVAGRVLRPLRRITATARTISAGNLHERLALSGPNDEFRQLGNTLDDLLARLEASFEAQRRFVANASHELRTPLTLERTLLQVALADPNASADRLRTTCEELLAAGRDHERLLEALLTLASSERGLERREPVDLAAVARRALIASEANARRLSIQMHGSLRPALTNGDPALIERLISNLVENAVFHNDVRGQVEVATARSGDVARVSVLNTGPVIAADDIERLFEPFQRLAAGRVANGDGHHGLGLSIVRAIATAHEASIDAEPLEGGGLAVGVSFPAG